MPQNAGKWGKTYIRAQQFRSPCLKLPQRLLPFPALLSSFHDLRLLCVHIPVEVDGFFQIKVKCRLERALLDWVELHPLYLDLKHRWEFANGSVLLGNGVIDVDLLDVKGAFDRSIDVTRARGHVDFDITPPFFP